MTPKRILDVLEFAYLNRIVAISLRFYTLFRLPKDYTRKVS